MICQLSFHIIIIGYIHMCCFQVIFLLPFCEHDFRLGSFQHTDPFSIQCLEIIGWNIRIWKICIQTIFLLTHRFIGKQHLLCTFFCIGNIAHNIKFAVYKLFKTVGPVTFHILKFPSGITCQSLHELVAITSSDTVFIDIIKGILKWADTNGLCLFFIIIRSSGLAVYW